MAVQCDSSTELGFVEKIEWFKLQSIFFPSKVGGKPAWLSQNTIPSLEDLTCCKCGKLMLFLLQVYAPREEKEECFHRTIYIFVCKNGSCCEKNSNISFKSFRSQLPRKNDFFSYEPLANDTESRRVIELEGELRKKWGPLCHVCGYQGDKRCAACKIATYCSKEHQVNHWKNGHKLKCSVHKSNESDVTHDLPTKLLLPEYEIVTEPEVCDDEDDCQTPLEEPNATAYEDNKNEQLAEEAFAEISDKQFEKFKKTIRKDPDQVLRYQYGGNPLWVSSEHQAISADIPKCSCGASRVFEFQVLPQLLNHLDTDSLNGGIDFGTLLVFTCSDNCTPSTSYVQEFVWKQDFSDTHIKFK